MKNILIVIFLLAGFNLFGQPPGYTKRNIRENVISFIVDSTQHIPRYCGTPTGIRNGGYVADGAIAIDTCNNRFYIFSGGAWVRMANFSELASYVAVSDSSSMLANYLRGATAGWGMLITGSQHKTWTVDSFSVASRARVQKAIDSLGAASVNIYNSNGSLNDYRTLTAADKSLTFTFNSIDSSGLIVSSTSTVAANNRQRLIDISQSGANSTSTQSTYGLYSSNTKTGTSSSNYGLYGISSGGTTNYGVFGQGTQYGVFGQSGANGNGVYGYNNGANGVAVHAVHDVPGGSTGYGLSAEAAGGTTAIGGYFSAVGATNNYAILVPTASGNVGFGTSSPSSKAILDLTSTTQGFLTPRMTTAQRDAITTPATGLLIWNTTDSTLQQYRGLSGWAAIGGGGGVSAANLPLRISGSTVSADTSVAYDPSLATNKRLQKIIDSLNAAGWGSVYNVSTQDNYQYYHDISGSTDANMYSAASGTGSSKTRTAPIAANWMGQIEANTGTTATGFVYWHYGNSGIILGINFATTHRYNFGTKIRLEDLSDGTDTYHVMAGYSDANNDDASTVDGAWFSYTHSASTGQWVFNTRSNSVTTSTATGTTVAADTDYELEISVFNGNAYAYINKTLVATHTTNIPDGVARSTSMAVAIRKSAGTTARKMYMEWLAYGKRSN